VRKRGRIAHDLPIFSLRKVVCSLKHAKRKRGRAISRRTKQEYCARGAEEGKRGAALSPEKRKVVEGQLQEPGRSLPFIISKGGR